LHVIADLLHRPETVTGRPLCLCQVSGL
jgi:hypothetical protein